MLDLAAYSGLYKYFAVLVLRTEGMDISFVATWKDTHSTRSHPIEEGGHVDRGADGPFGGVWRVLGSSSARVKEKDEPQYVDGRTSGLMQRVVGGWSRCHSWRFRSAGLRKQEGIILFESW